jgi:hypothetical protein
MLLNTGAVVGAPTALGATAVGRRLGDIEAARKERATATAAVAVELVDRMAAKVV